MIGLLLGLRMLVTVCLLSVIKEASVWKGPSAKQEGEEQVTPTADVTHTPEQQSCAGECGRRPVYCASS